MLIQFKTTKVKETKEELISIFQKLGLIELIYEGQQDKFIETDNELQINLTVSEHRAFKRAIEQAENAALFESELANQIYFMDNQTEIRAMHRALAEKKSILPYYNSLSKYNENPTVHNERELLNDSFLRAINDPDISTIILGECHDEDAAMELILQNIESLVQNHIAVVLENVAKTHQLRINRAVQERKMSTLLEFVVPKTKVSFVKKLIESGVTLVCGESEATNTLPVNNFKEGESRLRFSNYQIQKNAKKQNAIHGCSKCICLVGKEHAESNDRVIGLLDMMPAAVYFNITQGKTDQASTIPDKFRQHK